MALWNCFKIHHTLLYRLHILTHFTHNFSEVMHTVCRHYVAKACIRIEELLNRRHTCCFKQGNILSHTRELPGNALVNIQTFIYLREMAKHLITAKYWNSSSSKKKCLFYIDMTHGVSYVLTKVSSFQVRYLLLLLNSLWTVAFFQSTNQRLAYKLVDR